MQPKQNKFSRGVPYLNLEPDAWEGLDIVRIVEPRPRGFLSIMAQATPVTAAIVVLTMGFFWVFGTSVKEEAYACAWGAFAAFVMSLGAILRNLKCRDP